MWGRGQKEWKEEEQIGVDHDSENQERDCVQQRWREWWTSKSSDIYRVVMIK